MRPGRFGEGRDASGVRRAHIRSLRYRQASGEAEHDGHDTRHEAARERIIVCRRSQRRSLPFFVSIALLPTGPAELRVDCPRTQPSPTCRMIAHGTGP